jgi:hypothetical protein
MYDKQSAFNILRVYKAALEAKSLTDEQFRRAENNMYDLLKYYPSPEPEEDKND